MGFPDYVIRKHHVTRPIFEVSGLQNPEKSLTPFFTLQQRKTPFRIMKSGNLKGIFGKNAGRARFL